MKVLTSTVLRAFLSFVVVACVALPTARATADEDPLRLSLLNAAAKGGAEAHATINDFLKKSDDIKSTSQDEVWSYASKELGLEEKDFRSSALREQNADNFKELMKELDLEAVLIIDVFGKGKKFQLVAIGPSGREVADIRRDVNRGRLSKDDAKGVLKDTFKELVPNVRDFRDKGGWSAEDEEQEVLLPEEEEVEEEETEDLSLKEKAIKKREGKYKALAPGAKLQAGLLLGRRSLTMTSESGFELTHSSPFAGFGGKFDAIFTQLGTDSAIGGTIFGGYAPFTTIFAETATYPSQYARIGAELKYIKGFSPEFLLQVFGGAEAMSVTIEKNPFYTGNRYIMARLGVGILYQVGPILLEIAGAVLPVFNVNNSAGAFGETEGLALAFEPMGGLSFGITDEISALLRYSGQFYSVDYPSPVVLADPAKSTDVVHTGMVAIGYGL